MDLTDFAKEIGIKAGETSFSGVVSIFQGEKALYREAFGYADIANKRKNEVGTKFAIASGTKFFTALGIGTLIDAGKLSLDTRVREIFQKELSYVDSRATIAHLLTHSSGVYDYFDEEWDIDLGSYFVDIPWYRLETPSDYLPLFEGKKPKYSPGERFSYSNGGFILLGVIIEYITGRLYRDYICEKVFVPAGMKDSGFYAFSNLPGNTAYGFKKNPNSVPETNIYNLPIRGGSDGGAYTTVNDLHHFWKAVFGNRILSKELLGTFFTPHIHIEGTVEYGYGVYIAELNGMEMYYIVGGDTGVGFDSRYFLEKELQITVISNITDGEEEIRDFIYSNLGGIS